MYTTSRSGVNPNRPGVEINGERYWPVKIKNKSAVVIKIMNALISIDITETTIRIRLPRVQCK